MCYLCQIHYRLWLIQVVPLFAWGCLLPTSGFSSKRLRRIMGVADEPMSKRIDAGQRRQQVVEWVLRDGSVSITDLVNAFGVSQMTIHRDLDLLEEQGWLRKFRGGATATPSAVFESNKRFRERENIAEKLAVAKQALRFVEPGDAILLDDSTTVRQLVPLLVNRAPLTVITHSLEAINLLSGQSTIQLVALGGTYYRPYDAFLGLGAVEAIRSLRADSVFMSTSAITGDHCYQQSQDTVSVKRALIAAARQRFLLVDHGKFERYALHELAPLSDFDTVVVDAGINDHDLTTLRDAGLRVETTDEPHIETSEP